MDRFESMRVFVAVAEHGGFAAAGRKLRRSPPAITRAIAGLEDRLGARLLHRTTRRVRMTEAGTRFLADCKRILAELADAEASAAGAHSEPRGTLAVTASVMFGRLHVAPIVLEFLTRHPEVRIHAVLADRVLDMIDEGIDVAIRIAPLDEGSYDFAVPVGTVRRVVCAAPRYLARHGTPRTVHDLARLPAIGFAAGLPEPAWKFAVGADTVTVEPPTQLVVNSSEVAIAAAVAGHGVTRALSYQVADEVRAGRLRIVLADLEPPAIPIHVVYRDGRRAPARVRAFVDFTVARLRRSLAEPRRKR